MPDAPTKTSGLTLEDRQAIIDKTIRYCWAIDSRSYDDLDHVFTDDVHCDYSSNAAKSTRGLRALKDHVAGVLDRLDCSQHTVSNHQIEDSEDGPKSRCYFRAQHVRKQNEGSPHYVVSGIYTDWWRRTPDGWRSRKRMLEILWTEGNPAVLRP